jgi:hypothetical protein
MCDVHYHCTAEGVSDQYDVRQRGPPAVLCCQLNYFDKVRGEGGEREVGVIGGDGLAVAPSIQGEDACGWEEFSD